MLAQNHAYCNGHPFRQHSVENIHIDLTNMDLIVKEVDIGAPGRASHPLAGKLMTGADIIVQVLSLDRKQGAEASLGQ